MRRLNYCNRCGHKWFSSKDKKPFSCPKCRNPYWDRPRIQEMNKIIVR